MPTLTDRDRAMIDFEAKRPRHTAEKQQEIEATFGIAVARYYQLLNRIAATPAAIQYDAMTARRILRMAEGSGGRRTRRAPLR